MVTVTRCVTNFVLVCFGDQKRAEKRKAFCECHRNTTQPARHAKYLLSEFKCAFGRPISFLYTVGLKTAQTLRHKTIFQKFEFQQRVVAAVFGDLAGARTFLGSAAAAAAFVTRCPLDETDD